MAPLRWRCWRLSQTLLIVARIILNPQSEFESVIDYTSRYRRLLMLCAWLTRGLRLIVQEAMSVSSIGTLRGAMGMRRYVVSS